MDINHSAVTESYLYVAFCHLDVTLNNIKIFIKWTVNDTVA